MPIYEYHCKDCDHVFDVLQKMSDDLLTYCPECGKPELRKLISAPNFRLKGKGWYETDFKDKNQRNLASGSDKPAEKTAGNSSDSKTSGDKKANDSSGSSKSAGSDSSSGKSGGSSSGKSAKKSSSAGE
jgi:putative FmdB family regulatory protein